MSLGVQSCWLRGLGAGTKQSSPSSLCSARAYTPPPPPAPPYIPRSAAYVRDLVRLHPGVLAARPEALDWRLALLREAGGAVRSWRQELAGAAPRRLGALLTAPKRSLLRLKYTVERG